MGQLPAGSIHLIQNEDEAKNYKINKDKKKKIEEGKIKLFVKINSDLLYSLERNLDIFYLIPSFIDDG